MFAVTNDGRWTTLKGISGFSVLAGMKKKQFCMNFWKISTRSILGLKWLFGIFSIYIEGL